VPGHRLLAEDELQDQPIDFLLLLVDVLVAQDDRVGQLMVPRLERLDGVAQSLTHALRHLRDPLPDAVDVALQGLLQVAGHGVLKGLRSQSFVG